MWMAGQPHSKKNPKPYGLGQGGVGFLLRGSATLRLEPVKLCDRGHFGSHFLKIYD